MQKKLLFIAGMSMTMMAQSAFAEVASAKQVAKVACDVELRIERAIMDAAWSEKPLPYEKAQAYLQEQLALVKQADTTPASIIYQVVSNVATHGVKVTYSPKYFITGTAKATLGKKAGVGIYAGMTPEEIKLYEPMSLNQFKEYQLKSAYNACMFSAEKALKQAGYK